MATEQEELKLIVSLDDQASEKLKKINEGIKNLGSGEGKRHVSEFKEGGEAIKKIFEEIGGEAEEAFKMLSLFNTATLGTIAGVGALGVALIKSTNEMREFADKMRELTRAAEAIGVPAGALKTIQDAAGRAGANIDGVTKSLQGVSETLADIQRGGPKLGEMFALTLPTPEAQEATRKFIKEMQEASKDPLKQIELMQKHAEELEKNLRRRGLSEQTIQDTITKSLGIWGATRDVLDVKITPQLRDMIAYNQTLTDRGKALADSWTKVYDQIERVNQLLGIQANELKLEKAIIDTIGTAIEKVANAMKAIWPHLQGIHHTPTPLPGQSAIRGGFDLWRMLRGEQENKLEGGPHDKATEENTEATKQLDKSTQELTDALKQQGYAPISYRGRTPEQQSLLQQASFTAPGNAPLFGGGGGTFGGGAFPMGAGAAPGGGAPPPGGGGFPGGGRQAFPGGPAGPMPPAPESFRGGGPGATPGGGGQQTYSGGTSKQQAAQAVANEMRSQGIPENAIAGMMANIASESGFDPTLRHADQPKFGGEAHFAHGLFQEGGDEWNTWAADMRSRGLDPNEAWKDPKEQARFVAGRLKGTIGNKQYADLYSRMTAPGVTKEQAAQMFVQGYLRPAEQYRLQRQAQYGKGVPDVEAYTGKGTPTAQDSTSTATSAAPTGAEPNQADRPYRIGGTVSLGDEQFHWGSGGYKRGSLPYGSYPINVGDLHGRIGSSLAARGLAVASIGAPGGMIPDPKYPGAPREGILLHSASGSELDKLYSEGCFAISAQEWPRFKAALLSAAKDGPLTLNVGRDGRASIVPRAPKNVSQTVNAQPGTTQPPPPQPPPPNPQPTERNILGFRRDGSPIYSDTAQEDRAAIDRASTMEHKVTGSGKISVDVKAPSGTNVKASSDGMFKSTEVNRQVQMQPAKGSPTSESISI